MGGGTGGRASPERKHVTLPKSFADRLDKLKAKRQAKTDGEILAEGIKLLEAISDPDATVIIRDKDGKERNLMVP